MTTLIEAQESKHGELLKKGITCDTCGAPATHIHLLPWCIDTTEVALTGDCDCRTGGEDPDELSGLPEGYWFTIVRWAFEYTTTDHPRDWTMRDQVRTKGETGEHVVGMVDERIQA